MLCAIFRVKCLSQEHSTVPRPRLEPGPLDPKLTNHLATAPPTSTYLLKTSYCMLRILNADWLTRYGI